MRARRSRSSEIVEATPKVRYRASRETMELSSNGSLSASELGKRVRRRRVAEGANVSRRRSTREKKNVLSRLPVSICPRERGRSCPDPLSRGRVRHPGVPSRLVKELVQAGPSRQCRARFVSCST